MANIFSQLIRPVRSMQEYGQDMDAAEGNQLALSAKRMQMQQAEAGMQDQQRIRGLASQFGSDENALIKALRGGGYFEQAGGIEKQIGERAKSQADAAKSAQDVQSKKLADAEKRLQIAGQAFGYVKDNPSAESAASVVQHLQQNGIWDDKQVAAAMAEIQANPTPEGVLKLATRAFQGVLDAKEQLPKFFNQNRGGTYGVVGVNPVSGAAQDVQSAPITQSADSVARIAAAAEQGDKTRAQAERASLRVDSRARDAAARADGAAVSEVGGPVQAAMTKQYGKAPAGFRWKQDGALEPIPGGPADQKATTQQAGKETVDSVVSQLRQSYDSLDTGGGITSTQQGAVSNLGRRLSQSAVGQFAGGAVGGTNQKERDAIAQARPLLLQAIMKATGMSAKQMDSNAELKLYLATATDPTLSLQANREALDRIVELYGSGGNPQKPKTQNPAGGSLSAQEQSELDALRARFGKGK